MAYPSRLLLPISFRRLARLPDPFSGRRERENYIKPQSDDCVRMGHLVRDFQAMIDRGGPGQVVGLALLEHAQGLFAWWHWARDGTWQRSTFQSYVCTLRASFKMELEWGIQNACPKTAATCRELLLREAALWTFVRMAGIAPTNNAAERSLRGAVLWRKVSFGTQSESGSRFVASMLTVLMSSNPRLRLKARKQGVGAREFLRFAKLRGCDRSRVSP
jgi:hypothetical protein